MASFHLQSEVQGSAEHDLEDFLYLSWLICEHSHEQFLF